MTKSVSKRNRLGLQRLEERLTPTAGYFRVVTYNVAASGGTGIPVTGLQDLLAGMGAEPLPAPLTGKSAPPNQMTQQVDLIALQEVKSQATTSAAVAGLMNTQYGTSAYLHGSLNGTSTGSGTQGVVYNSSTLTLLDEAAIGTSSSSGMPRQPMRYHFQPVGYPSSAAFYIYVSHTKADVGATNVDRRETEAIALRLDADALGNPNIIYSGDFNTYTSTEKFFTKMYASAATPTLDGKAIDPINRPGSWSANNSFNDIFTQAPSNTPPSGFTGGGLDDRFDFQLISNELADGYGLDYVSDTVSVGGPYHTYHTFGVDGSIQANGDVNDLTLPVVSTALPTLGNRVDLLNKLVSVTDHLPVVADYRFELPPTVTSVTINDNSAQRSRITSVTVNFSRPVTYPNGINTAFQLTRQGDSASVTISATPLTSTSALLTFTGGAVNSGSLADGRYNLLVVATSVSSTTGAGLLDGNNDMIPGGNYSYDSSTIAFAPTRIFRLFGDSDGNGTTNQTDYDAFRLAYSAGPSVVFDYNSSSQVDQADYNEFRLRFLIYV